MPLDLFDLVPVEATFSLSERPNEVFTLCKWSLRIRAWATQRYTAEGLKIIFETQQIGEIADLAFFMLKEKSAFKSKDEFLECVVTLKDQIDLTKALLTTVGIGEPEIKKISDAVNKKPEETPEKKSE